MKMITRWRRTVPADRKGGELGVRRHTKARRLVALVATILLVATGCGTWRPVDVGSLTAPGAEPPSRVRVTLTSNDRVELSRPSVLEDSLLVGIAPPMGEVRLDLGRVRVMERREVSVGRTVILFLGVGAAALVGGFVVGTWPCVVPGACAG